MEDKVVMGARKDSLHDMIKFSGNEGAIVWPLWKNDLMERIRYELGKKAVQIVEGELKKDNIRRKALYDSVQQVAEMLAPKNRTGVQTNGSWIEVQETKLRCLCGADDGAASDQGQRVGQHSSERLASRC